MKSSTEPIKVSDLVQKVIKKVKNRREQYSEYETSVQLPCFYHTISDDYILKYCDNDS